jgi:nucleotide-binding universal stress UspA family protein
MYRSIVVPLDGSPFGEQALPLAVEIARRSAANLQIVHVSVPLAEMYAEAWPGFESTVNPALRRRGEAYLDAVVRRLEPTVGADVAVSSALLEGTIPEALQEHVMATGADLVVMTTHGRGPLARAWLGSVADTLVRRLSVPLLLVRPRQAAAAPDTRSALRHVLVPLDGSPFAEDILEPAVTLGGLERAEYTLLRVIPPMILGNYANGYPAAVGYEDLLAQLEQLHAQECAEAATYLRRVAAGLRERGLRVTTRVAVHEHPAVAILDEAKAHPDGFVALATRGRSGLPRLLLGSVADKVLRGSVVPVLVHRAVPAPQGWRSHHRASVTVV